VKRFVISLVEAADIHHVTMAMMKQIERVRMQLKAVTVSIGHDGSDHRMRFLHFGSVINVFRR
jgi:hypothetical protein